MPELVEWVKQSVSGTPGTGTITLGSAYDAAHIRVQDDSRISDGSNVLYTVEDGNNRERGVGTYTATGTTLSRDTIHAKLDTGTLTENPGTGLSLTSGAIVTITGIADAMGILVGRASATSTTYTSITNTVPVDDTLPTDTETDSIVSVSYTPKFADSKLVIRGMVDLLRGDSGTLCAVCIFRSGTSTALKTAVIQAGGASYVENIYVEHEMSTGATTSETFILRIGKDSGNAYINGGSSSSLFSTSTAAIITVEEIRQ